ncbi:hypothetical protein D9619_009383 [Psilocybe cf. subviscida]|uniref:Uncharacterized protein n=1 Tax=Psilocybe cf. subviscida TaxID=2480587 RepID=A0A8H5BV61_9AGAR|nr:hypothetical protein D9619_009383 [Psilocybe cf. subviscida]
MNGLLVVFSWLWVRRRHVEGIVVLTVGLAEEERTNLKLKQPQALSKVNLYAEKGLGTAMGGTGRLIRVVIAIPLPSGLPMAAERGAYGPALSASESALCELR